VAKGEEGIGGGLGEEREIVRAKEMEFDRRLEKTRKVMYHAREG
jgi:hypothetical protein